MRVLPTLHIKRFHPQQKNNLKFNPPAKFSQLNKVPGSAMLSPTSLDFNAPCVLGDLSYRITSVLFLFQIRILHTVTAQEIKECG